jgi:hypothetical protein
MEEDGPMNSTILFLSASLLGQAVEVTPKPDEKLEIMKRVASSYRFVLDGDRSGPLRLGNDPSFRMGKQSADNVLDGAIFFWSGVEGRPEAALQAFQVKDQSAAGGHWVQEFISLSPGTFVSERDGKPIWAPRKPGVEFKAVPGAPKPADTATQRSRQMRALAQEFRVSDNFKNRGWSELRLLTTPVARYGKAASAVLDGALFAFALATDPEAFLFLETREGTGGLEWQYAFAPMGCFEMKGTHDGKVVWTVLYKKDAYDPSMTYFVRLD